MVEAKPQEHEPEAPPADPARSDDEDDARVQVEVSGLTKFYQDIPAIQDVSFTLKKGEVVGFLGPNGAGKTTTMRILVGAIPATRGSARVCGYDVFESPLQVKSRVGYLPETPPIYTDLTVMEQLRLGASLKGLSGPAMTESIEKNVERLGLQEMVGRLCGNLSKGFRQRVGFAQALLGNPEVLILDEPTVGLDPK
jgi:ABC-2 type transport system ATP-binding protein